MVNKRTEKRKCEGTKMQITGETICLEFLKAWEKSRRIN